MNDIKIKLDPSISSFEHIYLKNREILDPLIAKFGPQVILSTWDKIKEPVKEELLRGDSSLSKYQNEITQKIELDLVKNKNRSIVQELLTIYPKSILQSIFKTLSTQTQELIQKGWIDLFDHIDELKMQCEKKLAAGGFLPSNEELIEFFQKPCNVLYEPGARGVYLIEGEHLGQSLKIVVKCNKEIVRETFGSRILSTLGIYTPETSVIDLQDKELFPEILKTLKQNKDYLSQTKRAPTQLCIMGFIRGSTLENLSLSDDENPDFIYNKVLFDIGKIAAGDFLLYNQDRLPIIGLNNPSNLMILKNRKNQCIGAAAIDQVASLSTRSLTIDILKVDPFDRIEKIVAEIVVHSDQTNAAMIFEALPKSIRDCRDSEKAIASIQKGILHGLSKINSLSSKKIEEIYHSLPTKIADKDQVDLQAHLKMLSTIQKALKKISPE